MIPSGLEKQMMPLTKRSITKKGTWQYAGYWKILRCQVIIQFSETSPTPHPRLTPSKAMLECQAWLEYIKQHCVEGRKGRGKQESVVTCLRISSYIHSLRLCKYSRYSRYSTIPSLFLLWYPFCLYRKTFVWICCQKKIFFTFYQ